MSRRFGSRIVLGACKKAPYRPFSPRHPPSTSACSRTAFARVVFTHRHGTCRVRRCSRRRAADHARGTSAWQSSQPAENPAASDTGTHPSKPGAAGSSPAGRARLRSPSGELRLGHASGVAVSRASSRIAKSVSPKPRSGEGGPRPSESFGWATPSAWPSYRRAVRLAKSASSISA